MTVEGEGLMTKKGEEQEKIHRQKTKIGECATMQMLKLPAQQVLFATKL
jgi:hypothetical protein